MAKIVVDLSKELKPYPTTKHKGFWKFKRRKMRRWHGVLFCLLFFFYFLIQDQLTLEEGFIVGWNYNTPRNLNEYISSNNLSFLIMPKTFCESYSFVVVMVCSAPSNFQARNAIRNTWGSRNNTANFSTSVYFLLGETLNHTLQREIEEEHEQYKDIIQERFVDSYNNLTLKTVTMLKLIDTHCTSSAKFLFKVDDDMFVNVPVLLRMLIAQSDRRNILIGHLICGAKPIKNMNSKWYAPRYMYPDKIYPNYLSGTGYVMSLDVVPKLFTAAMKTPLFHLEDVYITGICTRLTDVKPQHNRGFTYQRQAFDPCIYKDTITFHHLTPPEIYEYYSTFKNTDLVEECRKQQESFSLNKWVQTHIAKSEKKKVNKCH